MPPQHGKSELSTRRMPAKLLGDNPSLKIAIAAYNHTFASKFNRDIQRIIDTEEYNYIYPDTCLNASNIRSSAKGAWLRNSDEFEIVDNVGSLKSVGIGGALTGSQVDIMIVDDPYKDALQAYSQVYRDRVMDWWDTVAETRLHNESQVCIVMTRWHDDDIVGSLTKAEPDKWTVINFPAIQDSEPTALDPREIGAALWPERHNLDKLEAIQSRAPSVFSALYQGRPSPDSGNIVNTDWMQILNMSEIEKEIFEQPKHYVIDTAYTTKQHNDPSGLMTFSVFKNCLYIWDVSIVRKDFPALIAFIEKYTEKNGYSKQSRLYIEPKASGKSVVQQLRQSTALNVKEHKMLDGDKITRLNYVLPVLESMRVYLISGAWNKPFIEQIRNFPKARHDEEVDLLIMAIVEGLERNKKTISTFKRKRIR
jgi:predicted phage terminase large subunit-like protein